MTTLTPNTNTTSPWWTAEQVAAYLKFSPEAVRKMARNGIIPCVKVGKRAWRFNIGHIQDWLKMNHSKHDD